MSELKACPFCGKEVELNVFIQEDKDDSYFIECHNPDCNYTSADFYTKNDLIKYFNTRPLESALQSALTTAQEENKRYKDALEEIANGHRPADDIASGALHPDNYDALIPDEYKNGQLFIAGIPVYISYSTPDNTVLLGYATKEDAVKMANRLSDLIQSALNGGKNERVG